EIKKEKDVLFTPYHLSPSEAASLHTSSTPLNEPVAASTEISTPLTQNSSQAKTAVDILDTTYLSSKNFYLDIVRKEADDTIDFAVKCEGGLMSEDQIRAFVMEMVAEVERFAGDEEEVRVVVGGANEQDRGNVVRVDVNENERAG
ncbi:MAG: hypothetical protein Q9180_008289, partial [Flavoplaca navasiana]